MMSAYHVMMPVTDEEARECLKGHAIDELTLDSHTRMDESGQSITRICGIMVGHAGKNIRYTLDIPIPATSSWQAFYDEELKAKFRGMDAIKAWFQEVLS